VTRQLCTTCRRFVRKGALKCSKCKGTEFEEVEVAEDLNDDELRLLLNPPSKNTWRCLHCIPSIGVNSGNADSCWVCGRKRDKRAPLLWEGYTTLCSKVGIEPGLLYRRDERGQEFVRMKGGTWRLKSEKETV
jgi:hypothetical protein